MTPIIEAVDQVGDDDSGWFTYFYCNACSICFGLEQKEPPDECPLCGARNDHEQQHQ